METDVERREGEKLPAVLIDHPSSNLRQKREEKRRQ
jgi:hypothetical protein